MKTFFKIQFHRKWYLNESEMNAPDTNNITHAHVTYKDLPSRLSSFHTFLNSSQ